MMSVTTQLLMLPQREYTSTPKRPFLGWYPILAILAVLHQDLHVGSTNPLQTAAFMRSGESKDVADTSFIIDSNSTQCKQFLPKGLN